MTVPHGTAALRDDLVRHAAAPERPIRVLFVSHTAARGGCAASLRLLVEALPQTVEVHIATVNGPAVEGFNRVARSVHLLSGVAMLESIHGVPLSGVRLLTLLRTANGLRYGRELRQVIRQVKPDIVHLNERGMLYGAAIARSEGVGVVMHARSVASETPHWPGRVARHVIQRNVDEVIAIDQSVARSLMDVCRPKVIYNPVRAPASTSRSKSDPSVLRVTFLSGLLRFKGVWDLLEAGQLLRDRSDILIRIAGANSRDALYYQSLPGRAAGWLGLTRNVESDMKQWVSSRNLGDRVQFLGHVADTDELLRDTDVLVFPSHLNGPGRSVFEAGVLGVPSIVSLATRIEDIIRDGVNGLIVPERDPTAIAGAIRRLADDRELLRRLGESARDQYTTQFAAQRAAADTTALYEAVLRKRRRVVAGSVSYN